MDKLKVIKNYKIYLTFAAAYVIALIIFPVEGKFKYEYQRGRAWMYETLVAPIDFPILKTKEELIIEREKKASDIVPYYDYNKDVTESIIGNINGEQLNAKIDGKLFASVIKGVNEVYEKGVVSESESNNLNSGIIIIQRDKRAYNTPVAEINSVTTALSKIKSEVSRISTQSIADSILNTLQVSAYIVPNLFFDQKKTELVQREALDFISPTKGMIYRGQMIIAQGEIVTAEIEQILDSYRAEYEISTGYSDSPWKLVMGHALLLLLILFLLFLTIYFIDIKTFESFRKYLFILLMFLLILMITVFVRSYDPSLLYMVPYTVFALYMLAFFRQSFVFPIYMVILLPVLLLPQNGMELYMMNLAAGAIALVSFYYLNIGWSQFVNAFFVIIVMLIMYISFTLIKEESIYLLKSRTIIYILFNGVFVVILYPFVFLFEKIFSFVSGSKLKDLADTNGKLLLEFADKAPGSFQHALQVANLANAAAREIGGDFLLIKVGALYHDIGKIKNPQCFIENQAPGINYHKDLTSIESAREIIKHVEDGVAIAKKYNLPEIAIDFIRTHHAKSQALYFYNKYLNEGGTSENIDAFTYPGPLPTTKEQVVVLMADAVEAASRTLQDYSLESIDTLVDRIISQRLSDSQLVDADISMKEINTVKRVFKDHLHRIYHERIKYPDKKK